RGRGGGGAEGQQECGGNDQKDADLPAWSHRRSSSTSGMRAGRRPGPDRDYGITVALNRGKRRSASIEVWRARRRAWRTPPAGALGVTSAVERRAGASRSPRIAEVQGSGVLAQCP